MADNAWHTAASTAWDWFTGNEAANLRNLIGAAGQLGAAESAVDRLQGLGDAAKTRIGMPTDQGFYNTIKADTRFTPFSVTTGTGGPGTVTTDSTGGTFFSLSPEQQALASGFQGGGADFLSAARGTGAYGRPRLDAAGNQLRDAAGNLLYDDDAGYGLEQYIGTNKSLTDPFDAANLKTAEDTLYERLQAMRQPGQARDQLALDEKLLAQGRTGLQTAAYGGSPEQFAFEQAKLEQEAQDQLLAMQQARADAANIADWRQRGIGEAREDRALSGDLAGAFLDSSYLPTRELVGAMQPSLNMSRDVSTSARQLGGYGRDLASQELDYKMAAEEQASDIRREALNSIFGLLMSEQTGQANVAAANVAANSRAINSGDIIGDLIYAAQSAGN